MMGIQAAFKLFSHPAAEMKAVGFMMVLLFASAAAAAASFFLPFLGNLSKYLSYGVTFWWGAAVALMTAMNVFGPHPEIRCIGSSSGCMKAKIRYCVQQGAPSVICIGAAVFGLAFLIHKMTSSQNQQQA